MKRSFFTAVFALSLIVTLLISTNQPAVGFTKGKTIQIYLGVSPGGGHDTEARMIARWLPKYLPGEPKNIIVKNMPGAGGLIMTARVYNRSKPDGLTWAVMGSTQMGNQALGDTGGKYDLLKMPQLFSTSGSGAAIVRDFLGVKNGKELTKIDASKIAVSGRTLLGLSFLTDVIGLELLEITGYKYVVGYPGTAQMFLAFQSGEISYVGGTGLHHVLGKSGRYYEPIHSGKAVVLWQTGMVTPKGKVVRSPGTDIPTFAEVYQQIHGRPPSGPAWEAYKLAGPTIRTLNRSLVVPPGVSGDRVRQLRTAFDKLYQDPGYRKEWEKVFGLKLDYVNGGDADSVTKKLLGPSPGWDYLKNEFIPKLKAKKN